MSQDKIVGRIGINGRRKPPPRRVYGDGFEVVVGGDAEGVGGEIYLPHAGEWFEVTGGISLEMYERQARMQLLRARQQDIAKMTEGLGPDRPDEDLSPAERERAQRLRDELMVIAGEVGGAVTEQRNILAQIVSHWTWSDNKGLPLGMGTGVFDEESGLEICLPDAADFGKLELRDVQWIMQHALSDQVGNEGN